MRTIARITWKDMLVIFRDRAALILMLGGPLLLTIGMGLVSGAFGDNSQSTTLPTIPVLVINHDEGPLGAELVALLNSDELSEWIVTTAATDETAARDHVVAGEYAALVSIPAGFSAGMQSGDAPPVAVAADPARTISGGVVRGIVESFISEVRVATATADVTMTQAAAAGLPPEQQAAIGQQLAASLPSPREGGLSITVESLRPDSSPNFSPLAYFAPAMALLFLMYTVTIGARSFLAERQQKTLARMLVAPITGSQVLGGKVLGIFLSGASQVAVLIVLSALLFDLRWGSPLGVALLILAAAAAATGWGLLVASIATTPAQISTIGTTLMLTFGILGGSFVPLNEGVPVLEALSKITPNAWALDGFATLAAGGEVSDLGVPLVALGLMAAALFIVASLVFRRRQTALAVA